MVYATIGCVHVLDGLGEERRGEEWSGVDRGVEAEERGVERGGEGRRRRGGDDYVTRELQLRKRDE